MRAVQLPVLVVVAMAVPAGAQQRGLVPADYYHEAVVSDVAVSPKGDLVAFTVMTIVEKENRRRQEIWMQPLVEGRPAGEPFRYTSPASSASSPSWSPDGSMLAFQSRREKDPNSVWFIRVTAPGGEAFHIEGVDATPHFSPDGKWIAMVKRPGEDEEGEEASETGSAKGSREGWVAADAISKTLDEKRFDGRVITAMRYKRDGVPALIPDRSLRPKSQLFVVPAAGGEPRQITDLPFDVSQVVWSRDSRWLLFSGDELEDDEYNIDPTSDLYAVAVRGGAARKLTTNPGSEMAATISPDGTQLAYLRIAGRGEKFELRVVEIDRNGLFRGEPRQLAADWELTPGAPAWTSGGEALRFVTATGGNRHLFELTLGDGRIRQLTTGDRTLDNVSTDDAGTVMAYSVTDPLHPGDLFLARGDATDEARLTRLNDAWLADVTLVPPERLTWSVADGTGIEGWLVKPVGYDPDKSYPLILKIHGGPHSAYGNYWFRTFHILSASGFFVLYTNPRGSNGYGHEFMYATRKQWGEMDTEDLFKGIDTARARYPNIDPDRLGVSGGSYGGFMTNWLTATTDRFAAAVTSRSISNWDSWYGVSDAQGLTEYEFDGMPWENRELYRRLSPLSYVENVTAPTLIIHSEQDYRTPMADAEQWYMALKKRRIPVEMVRYPRSSHGLSRTGEPWLLVDRLERLRSWFGHWLGEGTK